MKSYIVTLNGKVNYETIREAILETGSEILNYFETIDTCVCHIEDNQVDNVKQISGVRTVEKEHRVSIFGDQKETSLIELNQFWQRNVETKISNEGTG